MNVSVYMILSGRDLFIGTATNRCTLLSLIELAKLKDSHGVSLHGMMETGRVVSGEMSCRDANELAMDETLQSA